MKPIHYFFFSIIIFLSTPIFAQTELLEARKLSRQGTAALDTSDLATAMRYFKAAQQLDTGNIIYRYQVASVYFLENNFKQSLKLVQPLLTHRDVSPNIIRLIANNYDHIGQQEKAIDLYKKGIELAPTDGKFYNELGTIYLMRKQNDLAAEYFEKGIDMDPALAINYYWACKSLLQNHDYWWGLLYGELFLNMERSTSRTQEISKLLYKYYNEITQQGQDNLVRLRVTSQKWQTKFEVACQESWRIAATKPHDSQLLSLTELRRSFLRTFKEKATKKSPSYVLLDFWAEIDENDYWEAYNFWLFNEGNPQEFENWLEHNAPMFGRFITWFVQHPLEAKGKKVTRH